MEFEEIKEIEEIPVSNENTEAVNDENVQIPSWDLTPPFDAVDRGEM